MRRDSSDLITYLFIIGGVMTLTLCSCYERVQATSGDVSCLFVRCVKVIK
jgi:hypothetical protein